MAVKDETTTLTNGIKATDGLVCSGLVVSVDYQDKAFEGKAYRVCAVSISDGKRVIKYAAYDRDGPLPQVRPFERCEVRVASAKSEKGNLSITGEIIQAG